LPLASAAANVNATHVLLRVLSSISTAAELAPLRAPRRFLLRGLQLAKSSSAAHSGHVDLLAVRHDQVEHLDARLVDVVLEPLRLAVENGQGDEREDGEDEAPG